MLSGKWSPKTNLALFIIIVIIIIVIIIQLKSRVDQICHYRHDPKTSDMCPTLQSVDCFLT